LFEVEGDPELGNGDDTPPPASSEDQDDTGMGRMMASRLMGGIPQLALILPKLFKIQVIMLQTLGL
jgi:hypothetical protein